MGNSMSSTHTEARIFLPQPTMPFVHIWGSQQVWLLQSPSFKVLLCRIYVCA